ncbi:hypothetical protein NVV94_15405 [Pseudomonas sp. LS1212]|uniref:hypothetical protein n=1 Tax=Pseudomonas sp. LS1212 TaxID=2972478 RepID=UPI00215D38CF|nr:hypothetical protein [Pseudomonas sp. LS1212]UVJ42059.1 hypothetical protein NVV94_15405 [Pseudomonas sp. LS1212]
MKLALARRKPARPHAGSRRTPYPDSMPLVLPEPVDDPDRTRWAEELSLTDEQRRDNAVVRQTHSGNLESYAGSAAEQALARRRRELL